MRRMLPKVSALARTQMGNLRFFKGAELPHESKQPEIIDFGALNRKNKRVAE